MSNDMTSMLTDEAIALVHQYITDMQCRNGDVWHDGKSAHNAMDSIASVIASMQSQLASVTAERDALRAQLDAVPVIDINDVCFRLGTFFDIYHQGVKAQSWTRTQDWLVDVALRMSDPTVQP